MWMVFWKTIQRQPPTFPVEDVTSPQPPLLHAAEKYHLASHILKVLLGRGVGDILLIPMVKIWGTMQKKRDLGINKYPFFMVQYVLQYTSWMLCDSRLRKISKRSLCIISSVHTELQMEVLVHPGNRRTRINNPSLTTPDTSSDGLSEKKDRGMAAEGSRRQAWERRKPLPWIHGEGLTPRKKIEPLLRVCDKWPSCP